MFFSQDLGGIVNTVSTILLLGGDLVKEIDSDRQQ